MTAKLRPNRVRRTYLGGGRIDAFTGFAPGLSGGQQLPEDWLASTTTAFNGTLEIEGEGLGFLEDGRSVADVAGPLPVLVKLLDSDERLVIQAHPSVPCAKRLFASDVGKTECWYFLPGTAPDACVYLGFRPGITRERWERAFETQEGLTDMLHRIPVKAGDFVFVEGGVPHAIGGGCFLVELQEPSDLMVVAERATPSGRRIPDAKLHGGAGWQRMFDVYSYDGRTLDETCAKYVRRASDAGKSSPVTRLLGPELTDAFAMWLMAGKARLELSRPACVAVVTEGRGTVNGITVKKGERLLLVREQVLETDGDDLRLVACA